MTITLTSELFIPRNENPSGMDMIIAKGASITINNNGNVVICWETGSCSHQSDLAFSTIIWEKALAQALDKALEK